MSHPHRLTRLALTAIIQTEHLPIFFISYSVAATPKFGSYSGVDWILKDLTGLFAVFDLIGNLCRELEVDPFIVDREAAVGAEQEAIFNTGNKLVQFKITGQ
jgi:hypothetical protein